MSPDEEHGYDEEPWPSGEDIERQRVEFESRAYWLGYGCQGDE